MGKRIKLSKVTRTTRNNCVFYRLTKEDMERVLAADNRLKHW